MRAASNFRTLALVALLASAGLAAPALAQTRDYTGQIASVGGGSLVVDNRSGDEVTFRRTDETRVTGARSSWGALAKGDRVTVRWKLGDNPRKAYEVVVRSKAPGR
jgi:hypothetical protein